MEEISGLLQTERGTYRVTMTLMEEAPRQRRLRWSREMRTLLLMRQDHRCALCQGPMGLHDSHIDHVMPLSKGGADEFDNLQLVHMNCNLRKGRRIVVRQGAMPWA